MEKTAKGVKKESYLIFVENLCSDGNGRSDSHFVNSVLLEFDDMILFYERNGKKGYYSQAKYLYCLSPIFHGIKLVISFSVRTQTS